ncbi:MAG: transglutaminase-like domain-containing protein [Halodesulfovibrio sp.]
MPRLRPALPHRCSVMVIMTMIMLLACLTANRDALARNVRVRGNMDSLISFEVSKTVTDMDAASTFRLSFVVPKSYSSPTFSQVVRDFILQFTPQQDNQTTYTDNRGNEIIEGRWDTPPSAVTAQVRFKAANTTQLGTLRSTAPFPVVNVPREAAEYLFGSEQVPTDDPRIRDLARELTAGAHTQYDAVQRICEWVVDNVRYVNPPQRFDALFSLDTGTGNCQNFSHLAAALMRTAGIPVRIVNGITLDEPYDISLSGDVMRTRMGLGRHSWIEVWFPDLGWTPYNPQSTAMFIANRFIRIEVGLDNRETVNDSKVQWTARRGSSRRPNVQEVFASEFGKDAVSLSGKEYADGPLKRLMLPVVEAGTTVAAIPYPEPAPDEHKDKQTARKSPAKPKKTRKKPPVTTAKSGKTQIKKGATVAFGNVDFPQNIDFSTYSEAPETLNGVMTLNRSFMVETAEYATTRLRQYAQVFTLPRALSLKDISLALHRYGGGGSLWIDLMEDDAGKPGELIATSELIPVSSISMRPGYRWVTFPFRSNTAPLRAGNYWIGLGYTGDPVINWFFTYGKPVGPEDGTRFRDALLSDWGGALSYEFNYRVRGVVQ